VERGAFRRDCRISSQAKSAGKTTIRGKKKKGQKHNARCETPGRAEKTDRSKSPTLFFGKREYRIDLPRRKLNPKLRQGTISSPTRSGIDSEESDWQFFSKVKKKLRGSRNEAPLYL